VQRYLPLFGDVAGKYRQPVGPDWRVDQTYARYRGHGIATYRIPRTFDVVSNLPKNPTGNILKSARRQLVHADALHADHHQRHRQHAQRLH
jgi:hypothetical protein